MNPDETAEVARRARQAILRQAKRANVGHIGSALSVVDIVASIFAVLRDLPVDDPDRDRVVLSKGHAALALFALLHERGVIDSAELDSYCADGGLLQVHPEHHVPGIDFATGSLGQGLPMAVGSALAGRMQSSERRVYAIVSDAECNEGSIWEAAMCAGHHRLDNLAVIIDLNGQQALGYLDEVSRVDDMARRWAAFGWDAHDVPGHDIPALLDVLGRRRDRPLAIVAHTTFGYGVDFMQNKIEWHYLPMDDAQYASAMRQVGAPA
jgi:transketolase